MKKKLLLYLIILCLFSACGVDNDPAGVISDKQMEEINDSFDTEITPPKIMNTSQENSEVTDIPQETQVPIESLSEKHIVNLFDSFDIRYLSTPFTIIDIILPGFYEDMGTDIFSSWSKSYYEDLINNNLGIQLVGDENFPFHFIVDGSFSFTGGNLEDFANIYTFVRDFNITEAQIRAIIADEASYYPHGAESLFPGDYTSEQIEAIVSMDKERIVRAFAKDTTIIKGENFYSLIWFLLVPIEAYADNDMTEEDLMIILKAYEEFANTDDEYERYIRTVVLDSLREKIDEYLGER